jgi:hypothetical protein
MIKYLCLILFETTIQYYMTFITSRTHARRGICSVFSFIFVCIVSVIIVGIFIVLFTLSLDFFHFGSLILKPYLHDSHT